VIALKNNLVRSSVLPKTSSELERDVNVRGNVRIDAALYARNLIIDSGPAEFKGAVYAHSELHVKNDAAAKDADIIFRKAAASSGSIVALLVKGTCVFGSDINAASVKLKNCFVGGSVFAAEAQLENAVVLGGVFASKTLSLHNVAVGTFNSPAVSAGGVNYLLYPTAFSVEPLAALPGTEFYNITLADLGALFKGEAEKPHSGKIRLDLTADCQRTVLSDADGTKTLLHSYSAASRVLVSDLLDMNSLENHFLIISGSLGSQVLKTYSLQKADGTQSEELSLPNIASFFFKILSGKTQIQELSGAAPFERLREKYGNPNTFRGA